LINTWRLRPEDSVTYRDLVHLSPGKLSCTSQSTFLPGLEMKESFFCFSISVPGVLWCQEALLTNYTNMDPLHAHRLLLDCQRWLYISYTEWFRGNRIDVLYIFN
jgi:hypothetical protein